jgi:hypothetical protein
MSEFQKRIDSKMRINELEKVVKNKYKKDFPSQGCLNWKKVILKTPEKSYYDGARVSGILLHDGNLLINGVLFLANQFEIIDEDPLKLSGISQKRELLEGVCRLV